jgi:hypothetical protein
MTAALYARDKEEEEAMRSLVRGRLSHWLAQRAHAIHVVLVSPCYSGATTGSNRKTTYAFPINVLRRHAVAAAETAMVFLSDADFLPSSGAADRIRRIVLDRDFDRHSMLVIPCFVQPQQLSEHSSWPPSASFSKVLVDHATVEAQPIELKEMLSRIEKMIPGVNHASTDYHQWSTAARRQLLSGDWVSEDASFPVLYTMGWEPYVVFDARQWRGTSGWFDPRFTAGWDKASFVYEAAVRGYHFRVANRVFVVHATKAAMTGCAKALGSFCEVHSRHAAVWLSAEKSRDDFAAFIQSLASSTSGASQNSPGVWMPRHLHSACLIYPVGLFRHVPIAFINEWLDEAYMALSQALAEQKALIGPELLSDNTKFNNHIASHWNTLAADWCMSVPPLLGIVRGGSRMRIQADSTWEYHQQPPGAQGVLLKWRHFIQGIKGRRIELERTDLRGQRWIQLSAQLSIYDLCTDLELGDEVRVWQCTFLSTVDNEVRGCLLAGCVRM